MSSGRPLRPGEIGTISVAPAPQGARRQALVRFRLPDGAARKLKRTASTKAEAMRLALIAAEKEIAAAPPALGGDVETLADLLLEHLGRIEQEAHQRAQTLKEYRRVLRHLTKAVDSPPLGTMTPSILQRLLVEHFGTTPANYRRALVIIRAAYRRAVADGVVPVSPVSDLRPPKRKRPEPKALTPQEVELLLTLLRAPRGRPSVHTPLYADAAVLQLAIGARIGEICALRWSDVQLDAESATISITGTVVIGANDKAARQDEPKTSTSRRMIRTRDSEVLEMLRRRKSAQSDPRVFPAVKGGWLAPRVVQLRWRRALAGSDLEGRFSTHSLRKTFTSARIAAGTPPERVAKWLGHSDASLVLRVYAEQRPEIHDV